MEKGLEGNRGGDGREGARIRKLSTNSSAKSTREGRKILSFIMKDGGGQTSKTGKGSLGRGLLIERC